MLREFQAEIARLRAELTSDGGGIPAYLPGEAEGGAGSPGQVTGCDAAS